VMYGVFITTLGGQLKHSGGGSGQVARMWFRRLGYFLAFPGLLLASPWQSIHIVLHRFSFFKPQTSFALLIAWLFGFLARQDCLLLSIREWIICTVHTHQHELVIVQYKPDEESSQSRCK
jgi:hypothetical protein